MTSIDITITVFRGEPIDYQKFRHPALLFEFNDDQTPVTIHAIGTPGNYGVEVRGNYNPEHKWQVREECQGRPAPKQQ